MIRYEDSTAEAAGDATDNVNDTNAQRTEQFLEMSHQHELKDETEQKLYNTVTQTHTACSLSTDDSIFCAMHSVG